jgi:GTP-binding protein Era
MPRKKPAPKKFKTRAGFASIIGRPNVGKSTLLNRIVGEKVAIVSPVPQTTRNAVRGIYTDERGQIVFIDTPGWHLGRDHLDRYMNQSSVNSMEGVDCIIHLVDTTRQVGEEERQVVWRLKDAKVPIIVGLNKIDLKGKHLSQYIALWEEARGKKAEEMEGITLLPMSGLEGTQMDKLIDLIFTFLPNAPLYYEADVVTDAPQKQVIADTIREKLFLLTREELPYSIAVIIEEMRPAKGNTTFIRAVILVERDSQKEIVIGHKGQMLKQVGTMARQELEVLLEGKVFLELFVKFRKNWRDDVSVLAELGYAF